MATMHEYYIQISQTSNSIRLPHKNTAQSLMHNKSNVMSNKNEIISMFFKYHVVCDNKL